MHYILTYALCAYICMYVCMYVGPCVCICIRHMPIECDGFKIAVLIYSIKCKKQIKENH